MQHLGKWAAGIVGGVLAIAVLFYAANATSAGTYNSALFVFVVLLVFVFAQIKRGFDQAYQARHDADDGGAEPAGGGAKASGAQAGGKASGTAKATASSGASAKKSGGQSTGKSASGQNASGKNAGAKQSGGRSGSGGAKSASAGNAAKTGLSESAPSGPTNGTGAKH
jgi:hypothetical protein